MPSDIRIPAMLAACASPLAGYRAALAATLEQLRRQLAVHRATEEERTRRMARELGPFAEGRIDPARFAELFTPPAHLTAEAVARIEEAQATLEELEGKGDALFVTRVGSGESLYAAVSAALAEVGRAFAAAMAVQRARLGLEHPDAKSALRAFPFSRWNRTERGLAPPIIIEVEGGDLQAGSLSEFLDGGQKIVLLVQGSCPAAPLVRLITPGTFVVQAEEPSSLARFLADPAPGIAAIVSGNAALFSHDPRGGEASWERLQIGRVPEEAPRRAIGSVSAGQQKEDLRLLALLAQRPAQAPAEEKDSLPAEGAAAAVPGAPADPAGRLAAWLLQQVDLRDAG